MPVSTLHLTNAYHEHSGGIRTMYHALLQHAEGAGRRMTLVVPGARDRDERLGRFTRIVHLRAPRSPVADGRYRMLLPHRFLPPGRGPLWKLLDTEQPGIVEICDKYSLCFLAGLIRRRRRRRRPVLVGLSCERMDDNLHAFLGFGPAARAVARTTMERVYFGMFDVHVANSEYTAEELRLCLRGRHPRPIHVCPPGVTLPEDVCAEEISASHRELANLCGDSSATVLLYAGRISPEKHVLVLPRVLSALGQRTPAVHLVIAGDGPLRARLESESGRVAPGRVHVLGHVGRRTLWGLLHACDVFLHPNPREPFGIGPLEAMAARTPVVAPASGGLLAYATHDNAWLSAPDPHAMAAAVTACLDDPAERQRRVARARQTAEAHTWPAAAGRIFALYDAVQPNRSINPSAALASAATARITGSAKASSPVAEIR
jgi:alpha-1,6-mannosyltransferase